MKKILCQEWEESERGWGIRPDGWSLHHSKEDCQQFIKEYWDRMPPTAPDEYSRPGGDLKWVYVSEDMYNAVKGNGLRIGQYLAQLTREPTGERYLKLRDKYADCFQPASDKSAPETVQELAEKAVQASKETEQENVEKWAQNLAEDIVQADEPKFYDPFEL